MTIITSWSLKVIATVGIALLLKYGSWLSVKAAESRAAAPTIISGTYYRVSFPRPVAHAVTEEFPAAATGLVQGDDEGFLRVIKNTALTSALGLNGEPFGDVRSYALITAHEILVAYCRGEPKIEKHNA